MRTRVLLASDIHWCHLEWYGTKSSDRLGWFVRDVLAEHAADPCAALLLLGDYSLDHWQWGIKGSWLNEGISNTAKFVETHMETLVKSGMEIRMIAGNHEQYGEELWNKITGHARQESIVCGDVLFILLDTFGGNLDPTTHTDGTYIPSDMAFIREQMAAHPDKRVILCAHFFYPPYESEEFIKLVREDDRILCLFAGHSHACVVRTPEEFGGKPVIYTGNYANSASAEEPIRWPWGFRELVIDGDHITSAYIVPANTYIIGDERREIGYSRRDEIVIA